jgi:adenylylsulfate kinase
MTSAQTVASANGAATEQTPAAVTASRTAGTTLWLTGLPSAGKTTLALALAGVLREQGADVEVLDGDEVRTHLSAELGFTRRDRETQVTRIGYVAELLARHGVIVIVPVIAPYQDAREKVRAHHDSHGTPILQVHLSTPVEVCAERDVKGLYAKAFRGEISAMTGVDDPYEIPVDPDLRIDTSTLDQETSVAALLGLLLERGRL